MLSDIIYYGDARSMSEVGDGSVSLVVTSPPYWNIKDYSLDGYQECVVSDRVVGQIGDLSDYREYLDELTVVWRECERVLEPNGKLCVNVPLVPILKGDFSTHHNRDIVNLYASIEVEILAKTGLYLLDLYIWNRTNSSKGLIFGSYPYPSNFYAQNTVEFVGVFVKGGKPSSRSKECKERSKLSQSEWVEFTKQVWDLPIPNRGDIAYGVHPAIMPCELVRRLVRLYSFVGDIVLDPFMGSGTTALVASQNDRRYIGYEINEYYRSVVNDRLRVLDLF